MLLSCQFISPKKSSGSGNAHIIIVVCTPLAYKHVRAMLLPSGVPPKKFMGGYQVGMLEYCKGMYGS